MQFALQPGDLISVAQLKRLEPTCPSREPVAHPYLLAKASCGGDCQQIPPVFIGDGDVKP